MGAPGRNPAISGFAATATAFGGRLGVDDEVGVPPLEVGVVGFSIKGSFVFNEGVERADEEPE